MNSIAKNNDFVLLALRVVFTLCLVGTVAFIFSNSSKVGELSQESSIAVTGMLAKVLTKLGMEGGISEGFVRKLAHMAEFALLGFWLMLTLRVYTRRLLSHISWPLFFGLLIPVADETLQLFIPGRSGQVQDIVIDFIGVVGGLCFGLFVLLLFRAFWEGLQGGEI